MFTNAKITLYLSSLNYQKKEYPCAKFDITKNEFHDLGNAVTEFARVYIPYEHLQKDDIAIINANVDYAVIDNNLPLPNAIVDEKGQLMNASELLRNGAKVITMASLKNYGSKGMKHYHLEIRK